MTPTRTTNLLRVLFVIASVSVGTMAGEVLGGRAVLGAMTGALFGLVLVLIDRLLQGLSLRAFSSATAGLLLGLLAAKLLRSSEVLRYLGDQTEWIVSLVLYAVFGYLGMMLAMRSNRDEFSLVIPYIRFSRLSVQDAPLLVDTNIIIDGRIQKLCETGFLSAAIIVPLFVLEELQKMADSSDPGKRQKGRRGLELLEQMRGSPGLEVSIHESGGHEGEPVDRRLLQVATVLQARLLTNDANLCKIARLQGVAALNLNELAQAMRPRLATGDDLDLDLVKTGRDPHQAVGYLPDGTMIVVNNARDHLGQRVKVVIAGNLQTSAGTLFFAELKRDQG